jgi:hypothetical protein
MFSEELVNTSSHIVTHIACREDEALFVAVEANYKDPFAYGRDRMRSIQAKVAAAAESPWNNSLPAKIANDLSTFAGGYLFLAL